MMTEVEDPTQNSGSCIEMAKCVVHMKCIQTAKADRG